MLVMKDDREFTGLRSIISDEVLCQIVSTSRGGHSVENRLGLHPEANRVAGCEKSCESFGTFVGI